MNGTASTLKGYTTTTSRASSVESVRAQPKRPVLSSNNLNDYCSTPGRPISFITPLHADAKFYRPSGGNKFKLFLSQTIAILISSTLLLLVVLWATLVESFTYFSGGAHPIQPMVFPWDDHERYKGERRVKDVRYYAQAAGFDIVNEEVETEDGYYLRIDRVVNPRQKLDSNGKGGYPVLILHGLFQCSGAFITSEERSLAFWLSEHGGYQVFLGNTRGVFDMGHKSFSRNDPRFWDWTIRELAQYDLPAMIEWICDVTGYEKIAFIGHSQGNGLAFLSLSEGMRPEIGERLSCFIALAPVVYAGPLTRGFPFTTLNRIGWKTWKLIFGVLDFIPLMRIAYYYSPANLFGSLGYVMFAYLFSWTDTNWLKRRKLKVFRFTPTPVSSASIFWWCGKGGFAQLKCTMNEAVPQWFTDQFPPLAIYHGGRDHLVATEPLLERIQNQENHVKLLRVAKLEDCEHCDFYLAADAVERCFSMFIEDIDNTRRNNVDNSLVDVS